MITVKFSHDYSKFPVMLHFETTRLIGVELVNIEDLDPEFIEADTAIKGGGHYPLPKSGRFIILRLDTAGKKWQTIRRWTPGKAAYYMTHIGDTVRCQVGNV